LREFNATVTEVALSGPVEIKLNGSAPPNLEPASYGGDLLRRLPLYLLQSLQERCRINATSLQKLVTEFAVFRAPCDGFRDPEVVKLQSPRRDSVGFG
jgi:hypothetical protein